MKRPIVFNIFKFLKNEPQQIAAQVGLSQESRTIQVSMSPSEAHQPSLGLLAPRYCFKACPVIHGVTALASTNNSPTDTGVS